MGTARAYTVRGYRNTGYSAGVIGEVEFDRPFSKEVLEELYPDGDPDVIDFDRIDANTVYLLRTTYNKSSIRLKWKGTQKDKIFQVDYLRIKAENGGDDAECTYFFVDQSMTRILGNSTYELFISVDEFTTANASQTVEMNGIIEARHIDKETEVELNSYPIDFTPLDPMESTVAFVNFESGDGYTVVGGIPQTSGVKRYATVYCDLGELLAATPAVKPLPVSANSLTVKIEGAGGDDVVFKIDGMVLVDTDNGSVKAALNKLREMGNEGMIGPTFAFPQQFLRNAPLTYTSHGVDLIYEIHGGACTFTIDGMQVIPSYGGIYDKLENLKAGYHFVTYTIMSPASGESKTYTLYEIIEGATSQNAGELHTAAMKWIASGVPIANGAAYWRPAGLTQITPVEGYDSRVIYLEAVRGSDWNDFGLSLSGRANEALLAYQLQAAQQKRQLTDDQATAQLELSKANISLARMQSAIGMSTGIANIITSIGKGGILGGIAAGVNEFAKRSSELGVAWGDEGIKLIGDEFTRLEKQAQRQYDLAIKANELGLEAVQVADDYSKRNSALAVLPPTGLDMNRVNGASLLVIRQAPSVADVIRCDKILKWKGTPVHEVYTGKLKEHPVLLNVGQDFAYVKLGMCTITLPEEPSGWANSLSWKRKIHTELQTGGRLWKIKRLQYTWDVPIPADDGYVPGGSGPRIFYQSLIAEGTPTTTHLKVQVSEDIPLEDIEFTVSGASYTDITKTGYGEYLIKLVKQSFSDRTSVSVSVAVEGYAVIPKSRSVSVVKEWQPSKIGGAVKWTSAETPPWELGLELVASNEVAIDKHYLLWQLSNNFIITYVEKDKHMFYAAINSLAMDEPDVRPGIAIIGGRVYLVHSGGKGSVYRVDVLTGVQDTLTRILGRGSATKEVGNVGYGNFLVKYNSSGTAVSVHRYFPNSVRTRVQIFYSARPFRYPFTYLSVGSMDQPVGIPLWWVNNLALDEDLDGENPVRINGTSGFIGVSHPTYLEDNNPPNPMNMLLEFYGNWNENGFALNRLDGDRYYKVDDSISLGGAVYPQGMYLNRGGQWFYRYLDGEEREVEEVLSPMMNQNYVLPYWTDGIKVYRILG